MPHAVTALYGAGKVLLRPAAPGTGVIAGGAVRAVVESAGIQDILTKSLGSSNKYNIVHATVRALKSLRAPEQVASARDKPVDEVTEDYPVAEVSSKAAVATSIVASTEPGGTR